MSEVIDYKYMKVTKNNYRKEFFTRMIRETIAEILTYEDKIGNSIVYKQVNGTIEDTLKQLDKNPGFEKLVDLYIRISNALSCVENENYIKLIKDDILTGRGQVLENIKIPVGEINNM